MTSASANALIRTALILHLPTPFILAIGAEPATHNFVLAFRTRRSVLRLHAREQLVDLWHDLLHDLGHALGVGMDAVALFPCAASMILATRRMDRLLRINIGRDLLDALSGVESHVDRGDQPHKPGICFR